MVAGELPELAVTEQICAAVANVNDADLVVGDECPGEGRAHAAAACIGARQLEDLAVGLGRDTRQPLLCAAALVQVALERLRRDLRCHFAGLRPSHPVCHRISGRPGEVGILVGETLTPSVSARRLFDNPQHDLLILPAPAPHLASEATG
jgi:hypothetical protein